MIVLAGNSMILLVGNSMILLVGDSIVIRNVHYGRSVHKSRHRKKRVCVKYSTSNISSNINRSNINRRAVR